MLPREENKIMQRISRNASMLMAISLLIGIVAAAPGLARADLTELGNETMLEDQGALVGLLGYNFGPDPSSPLSFKFSVDSKTGNFNYSSTSSTYLGQPVSVSDTGTFDGVSNYSMSGKISLGGETYTTSATGSITTLMDGSTQLTETVNVDDSKKKIKANDIEIYAIWLFGKSVDYGYFTKDDKKIPKSDFVSTDRYRKGYREYDLYPIFPLPTPTPRVHTVGDETTFTSTVYPSPVPEPSSLTVIALCGFFAAAHRASHRRLRSP
jgi:hypothetical protein